MRVLDSNILIYHLNDQLPSGTQDRVDDWIREGATISVITRIEVLYPLSDFIVQAPPTLPLRTGGVPRSGEGVDPKPCTTLSQNGY